MSFLFQRKKKQAAEAEDAEKQISPVLVESGVGNVDAEVSNTSGNENQETKRPESEEMVVPTFKNDGLVLDNNNEAQETKKQSRFAKFLRLGRKRTTSQQLEGAEEERKESESFNFEEKETVKDEVQILNEQETKIDEELASEELKKKSSRRTFFGLGGRKKSSNKKPVVEETTESAKEESNEVKMDSLTEAALDKAIVEDSTPAEENKLFQDNTVKERDVTEGNNKVIEVDERKVEDLDEPKNTMTEESYKTEGFAEEMNKVTQESKQQENVEEENQRSLENLEAKQQDDFKEKEEEEAKEPAQISHSSSEVNEIKEFKPQDLKLEETEESSVNRNEDTKREVLFSSEEDTSLKPYEEEKKPDDIKYLDENTELKNNTNDELENRNSDIGKSLKQEDGEEIEDDLGKAEVINQSEAVEKVNSNSWLFPRTAVAEKLNDESEKENKVENKDSEVLEEVESKMKNEDSEVREEVESKMKNEDSELKEEVESKIKNEDSELKEEVESKIKNEDSELKEEVESKIKNEESELPEEEVESKIKNEESKVRAEENEIETAHAFAEIDEDKESSQKDGLKDLEKHEVEPLIEEKKEKSGEESQTYVENINTEKNESREESQVENVSIDGVNGLVSSDTVQSEKVAANTEAAHVNVPQVLSAMDDDLLIKSDKTLKDEDDEDQVEINRNTGKREDSTEDEEQTETSNGYLRSAYRSLCGKTQINPDEQHEVETLTHLEETIEHEQATEESQKQQPSSRFPSISRFYEKLCGKSTSNAVLKEDDEGSEDIEDTLQKVEVMDIKADNHENEVAKPEAVQIVPKESGIVELPSALPSSSNSTEESEFGENVGTGGVEVWRVRRLGLEKLEEFAGDFYSGDCYLVLNSNYPRSGGKATYDIHFWIGKDSSLDEQAVAAIKAVELDQKFDGRAIQHREEEYYESPKFQTYFVGMRHLKGGYPSGLQRTPPEFQSGYKRLFWIKRKKKSCAYYEIDISDPKENHAKKLNHGDVFVLDLGVLVIQWLGSDSNPMESFHACLVVNNIIRDRNGSAKKGTATDEKFWQALNGTPEDVQPAIKDDIDEEKLLEIRSQLLGIEHAHEEKLNLETVKLYRVSDDSGSTIFELIDGKPMKSALDHSDVFVLQANIGLWIWEGADSTQNEKASAFRLAKEFIEKYKLSPHLPITRIRDGQSDMLFDSLFAH